MPESLERYPGMIGTKVRFECEITPGIFIPTVKELQIKKEALENRKATLQSNYEYYRDYEKVLRTVSANVDDILGVDTSRQNSKQHEELS